jgi:hypothetical protein
MVERGAPAKKPPRGFLIVVRQVGRLWGSVATMILGAAALGCAIAGVSAIVLAAITPQEPTARAFASAEKTGAAPLAGGPIESRSAWVDQTKQRSCIVIPPRLSLELNQRSMIDCYERYLKGLESRSIALGVYNKNVTAIVNCGTLRGFRALCNILQH